MRRGSAYSSTAVSAALLLAACSIKLPPAAGGGPIRTADVAATAACPVAPTPLPFHGSTPMALAFDGVQGVPGFGMASDGSGATPRIARLTVKAYPGSVQLHLTKAHVRYVWPADGATRDLDIGTLPLSPVFVPRAPKGGGYGAPVEVDVPLPARPLANALAGTAMPSAVQARISLLDGYPALRDENNATFTARVEIPTGTGTGPGVARTVPCSGLPTPGPYPLVDEEGIPHVVDLMSFSPASGLMVSAGALASRTVQVTLRVPNVSARSDIASGTVTFSWIDAAGKQQETGAVYHFAPFSLPAGSQTAFGAPVTLSVPLDIPALARATHNFADVATGVALTHMRFTDSYGYLVQNIWLQPLDVQIPLLVK